MFPQFNFTTGEIENTAPDDIKGIELGRVFLFDWNNKIMIIENGKPVEARTDKEKVEQFLQYLLRNNLDKYKATRNTGFGTTYQNYIGNNIIPNSYINSELKREITEQVLRLNVVDSITNFKSSRKGTWLNVEFKVELNSSTNELITSSVSI